MSLFCRAVTSSSFDSISSLLTLAGLEDPTEAPSFQSVVLDQIKHLRKQLDEDEQAAMMAEGRQIEHGGQAGGYVGDDMSEEGYGGRGMRHGPSVVLGLDGLPQMVAQGQREDAPALVMQV